MNLQYLYTSLLAPHTLSFLMQILGLDERSRTRALVVCVDNNVLSVARMA